MPSYTSLLVLALAASAAFPVLSAELPEKNERPSSSHPELIERGLVGAVGRLSTKQKIGLGALAAIKVAIVTAAVVSIAHHYSGKSNSTGGDSTNSTQVAGTTAATVAQRANPAVPIYGRDLPSPVDTPKARSFDNNQDRRTTPHVGLLSRAEFGEALSLFSRVLDRLD